jgi:GTP-binding protein YchF
MNRIIIASTCTWLLCILCQLKECDSFALYSSFLGSSQVVSQLISCNTLTMKIRVGLLGLPNVGKSTLFNAVAQQSIAQVANFPFCTIDPNRAAVPVPDAFLKNLGNFANSAKTIPATIEWVDVAGLAKGAHRGEGLGNRFLGNLRECSAIVHLVRFFEDPNIVHVDGKVDPLQDIEIIHLELILADLAHVERRLEKTNVPEEERTALEQVVDGLRQDIPARAIGLSPESEFAIKSMGLLTLKPVMYAFNVDEVDYTLGRQEAVEEAKQVLAQVDYCDPAKDRWTLVSAKLEAKLSQISNEEQREYLTSLDIENIEQARALLCYNVLPTMVQDLLGLSMVYTGPGVPPERSRTTKAHLFSSTMTADEMAGRLHGEIQKGFIRAEVMPASILLDHVDYAAAKDAGCVRAEGRGYELQSNDVVLIKWK